MSNKESHVWNQSIVDTDEDPLVEECMECRLHRAYHYVKTSGQKHLTLVEYSDGEGEVIKVQPHRCPVLKCGGWKS